MLADAARFAPAEDPAVIQACFSCPYCLEAPTEVMLELMSADEGGEALCSCECCEVLWRLALDADQSLRMAVAPPAGLAIRAAS